MAWEGVTWTGEARGRDGPIFSIRMYTKKQTRREAMVAAAEGIIAGV
jgi:hypothetical protein